MQVTAATPAREHEQPMSWPRAMLIAVGFFFVMAILLGQLPSYVYTVVTLSTLARMEQGFLDLGLLALGLGVLSLEISLLYDPRPLIPWPLFAAVGAGIAAVGTFFVYQVSVGLGGTNLLGQTGWSHFLPDTIQHPGAANTYWPVADQRYLFHPAWFQPQSIDLSAVGMLAILIGAGMLTLAVLNPFVLGGRLAGPTRDLLVRGSLGLAIVIGALWLISYTFAPQVIVPDNGLHGPLGNILLFLAMMLALFALLLWLLPIMTANRQQFMPAVYLHGVVGLIGMVAVPLLLLWAVVYPLINLIHGVDTKQFWVQCSQKTVIPGSCSFTQFTGYLVCAIVFTNLFAILVAGHYFWSTRRNTVVLGGTVALIFLALAATIIHVDDPVQLPLGMLIAAGILVLAFIYTWATQREFAPTTVQQLGCMGQWLVLGTLMIIFLVGFAFFSLPHFFELESGLAFFYQPGTADLQAHNSFWGTGGTGIHDAFWVLLLMGGLAALQMAFLIRRQRAPLSGLRAFALVAMLVAVILLVTSGIQGFHNDVLSQGIDAMEGSHAIAVIGLGFGLVGVLACLYGAFRARGIASVWTIAIVASVLVGIALAFIAYSLPGAFPELVLFGLILTMAGALAYTALGPDAPTYAEEYANGGVFGDHSPSSFVASRQ